MSMIPLRYRDWWEDFDRPMRLFDQNFGHGLRSDDLIHPMSLAHSNSGYYRPWRHLTRPTIASGTSTVHADKEKFQPEGASHHHHFQVMLDVQQFHPDEITVKTVDTYVVIEGKHEEKPDEHGFITRHFVRRYMLPSDVEPESVTSSLSSDGVLNITAPKKPLEPPKPNERMVPIQKTGVPAVNASEAKNPIGEKIVEVKQE